MDIEYLIILPFIVVRGLVEGKLLNWEVDHLKIASIFPVHIVAWQYRRRWSRVNFPISTHFRPL